ncbi:MAG: hypothetical protein ABL888_17660 [Pirellulaceae bacterium]
MVFGMFRLSAKFTVFTSLVSVLLAGLVVSAQDQQPSNRSVSQLLERLEGHRITYNPSGQVIAIEFKQFTGVSSFGELCLFDKLDTIDVEYAGQIQNHTLSGIGLLQNLKKLKLRYADEITSDAMAVLQYVPNLEELLLTNARQVTNLGPLNNCARLKRVTLEFTNIDWSTLLKDDLASRMPIEELTISGDSKLAESDFEVLAAFPKLKKVTILESSQLTDGHLSKLAQSSSLRTIMIEKCNQVTGSFLKAFDQHPLDEMKVNSTGFKLESINEYKNIGRLVKLSLKTGFVGRKPKSEILGQSPYSWVSQLSNLEELEIDSRQFAVEELVSLTNSKRLRHLNVVLPRNSTIGVDSANWISNWPNLEALRLSGGKAIPTEWTRLLMVNPKLEELILEKCEFKDDAILSIFDSRSLKRLGFISCNLTDGQLARLPQLKDLETVDLLNNSALTDAAVESIASCPKLKHLRISAAKGITGSGFQKFPADAPLETLMLIRLNTFTPMALETVLQLKNLKEFSFFSDGITKEHFEALKYAGSLETVIMEPQDKLDEIFRWQLSELRPDLAAGNTSIKWTDRFRLLRPEDVED